MDIGQVKKAIFQIYRYDAWCCTACNEWLEEPCADPGCPFCGKRPQTPYEAYFMEDTEVGSAGLRKRWRQSNYQHKADGRERHRRHREFIEENHMSCNRATCAVRKGKSNRP